MLNPFPIQFLALLAYFILRLFVGGLLLFFGYRLSRALPFFPSTGNDYFFRLFALAEIVTALLIIVGAFTQYAALGIMSLCILALISPALRRHELVPQRTVYILLFGCALTLFITGAGAFAFDLPI